MWGGQGEIIIPLERGAPGKRAVRQIETAKPKAKP